MTDLRVLVVQKNGKGLVAVSNGCRKNENVIPQPALMTGRRRYRLQSMNATRLRRVSQRELMLMGQLS